MDDWYIAEKDGKDIDIQTDMIEDFAKIGYEIFKMEKVKVEDVDAEVKKLKEEERYSRTVYVG